MDNQLDSHEQLLAQALVQLNSAIDLLDQAQAPEHIAAHVDLAIHQLRDAMSASQQTAFQMAKNAELH